MRQLAKSHHQLQKQVGGLSDAVGYGIEDRRMVFIPEVERYVAEKHPRIKLVKTYVVELRAKGLPA